MKANYFMIWVTWVTAVLAARPSGNSLYFSGVSGDISENGNGALKIKLNATEYDEFTFAAWIKFARVCNTTKNDCNIDAVFANKYAGCGDRPGDALFVGKAGSGLQQLTYESAAGGCIAYTTDDYLVPSDEWVLVAFTRSWISNMTTKYLISDRVFRFNKTFNNLPHATISDCYIGAFPDPVRIVHSFNGSIDNVGIWSKVLTETEISNFASNPFDDSDHDSLIGYFTFDNQLAPSGDITDTENKVFAERIGTGAKPLFQYGTQLSDSPIPPPPESPTTLMPTSIPTSSSCINGSVFDDSFCDGDIVVVQKDLVVVDTHFLEDKLVVRGDFTLGSGGALIFSENTTITVDDCVTLEGEIVLNFITSSKVPLIRWKENCEAPKLDSFSIRNTNGCSVEASISGRTLLVLSQFAPQGRCKSGSIYISGYILVSVVMWFVLM